MTKEQDLMTQASGGQHPKVTSGYVRLVSSSLFDILWDTPKGV